MNKIIIISMSLIVASCSVNKTFEAVDGSKSDGVVKMSYSYGSFEKPKVDFDKSKKNAKIVCDSWGYTGVSPFSGSQKYYNRYYSGGCDYIVDGKCRPYVISKKYQCVN